MATMCRHTGGGTKDGPGISHAPGGAVTLLGTLLLLVGGLTFAGRTSFRRYALKVRLVDIPNERSSHGAPTPRGGGIAIVGPVTIGSAILAAAGYVPIRAAAAYAFGGSLVAAVGLLDDWRGASVRVRLAGQFASAAAVLALIGSIPFAVLPVPGDLGTLLRALGGLLFVVWNINLYNFMDGIDDLATTEAASFGIGGSLVALGAGSAVGQAVWPAVIASAAIGYSFGNRGPARIFLGDVGSGFLGFTAAFSTLWAADANPDVFWSWVVLLLAFSVDATFTLFRRLARRQRAYEPHRSHAYQRASRRFGDHAAVTRAVAAINALWLAPIALLVATGRTSGPVAVVIAIVPLLAIEVWLSAGTTNE